MTGHNEMTNKKRDVRLIKLIGNAQEPFVIIDQYLTMYICKYQDIRPQPRTYRSLSNRRSVSLFAEISPPTPISVITSHEIGNTRAACVLRTTTTASSRVEAVSRGGHAKHGNHEHYTSRKRLDPPAPRYTSGNGMTRRMLG